MIGFWSIKLTLDKINSITFSKIRKPQHEVLSVEDLDFAKTKTKAIALFPFRTYSNNVPPSKREFDAQKIYHKTNISSFKDLEKIIL